MATLDDAPKQLQHWITELDGRIDVLNEQRAGLARALGVLDGSAFAIEPPPTPTLSEGLAERRRIDDEGRKARDRDRKKRQRAGTKAPPGSPGTSKYDYAEVARIANAAVRGGESAVSAVASRFGVSVAMGSYLIKTARQKNHHIAKGKTGKAPVPRPANVTPIAKPPAAKPVVHEGNRSFTPDDTLRIIEGG